MWIFYENLRAYFEKIVIFLDVIFWICEPFPNLQKKIGSAIFFEKAWFFCNFKFFLKKQAIFEISRFSINVFFLNCWKLQTFFVILNNFVKENNLKFRIFWKMWTIFEAFQLFWKTWTIFEHFLINKRNQTKKIKIKIK